MSENPLLFLSRRAYSRHFAELSRLGYRPQALDALPELNPIVADHADTLIFESQGGMLLSALPLDGAAHISAKSKPHGAYPDDTALNALALGGCLFGRLAALSPELTALAEREGLRRVNVRQGYTRCSVLPLYDNAAISADRGLCPALRECGIDVLEISPGQIALEGCEYGFIGGASIVDRQARRVIFYGSLACHSDGDKIADFCRFHGFEPIELTDRLSDFGGGVIAYSDTRSE